MATAEPAAPVTIDVEQLAVMKGAANTTTTTTTTTTVTTTAGKAAGGPPGLLPSAPFKYARVGLYVGALLLALAVLVAQSILMNHKYKGYYFSYFLLDSGYYYSSSYTYSTWTWKGKQFAKAPALVIAVAVIALVLAAALLVFVLIPAVSVSLWAAILEVALVPMLVMLWISAIGVSAKTASVFTKGSGWPKAWVSSNGATLAFEVISFIAWVVILVLATISLIRIARARKAAQNAPAQWLQP